MAPTAGQKPLPVAPDPATARASSKSNSSAGPGPGHRRASENSASSSGSYTSSISGGNSTIMVTTEGEIVETGRTSNGQPAKDNTFSALLLSGNLARLHTSLDFEEEENRAEAISGIRVSKSHESMGNATQETTARDVEDPVMPELTFFPDPPCVLPCEDLFENTNTQTGIHEYWWEHATVLECWPGVQERRARNMKFMVSTGNQKRHGMGTTRKTVSRAFKAIVNITNEAIGLRWNQTQDDSGRTGETLNPGELVVYSGLPEEKDGVRYYNLKYSAGYVFDRMLGKRVIEEVQSVECGHWWYRVVCEECVEIRSAPSYSDETRTGWVMCKEELVAVVLRCRVNSSQFLLLHDGRGWAFTYKPTEGYMGHIRAGSEPALEECSSEFLEAGTRIDFRHLVPPTDQVVEVGMWTYVVQQKPVLCVGAKHFGTFLTPGDIIKVDKRTSASGEKDECDDILDRKWVRLSDGRGWAAVVGDDGKVQLKQQESDDLTYPAWFSGTRQHIDKPEKKWMAGFA